MKTAKELAKNIRAEKLTKEESIKLVAYIMMNHDIMIEDLGMPVSELEKALNARKKQLRK